MTGCSPGAEVRAGPDSESTLATWLGYLESIHSAEIELGLERLRPVAARLCLPERKIRSITIAGTNGKGSSALLCEGIYRQAGYRVGLYTSPHLLKYNERVRVDGRCVSDQDLIRAFVAVEAARASITLTYFEFGTLAALYLFRELDVQIQVLEVGLGGRLDAVNIVDSDAALLTSIGLDHKDWLGPDRESIAREKAAVFRSGCPAVCSDPQPPAIVASLARDIGAERWQLGKDFHLTLHDDGWQWKGGERSIDLPAPAVAGQAQLRNAAGVVALVQGLAKVLPVADENLRSALRTWCPPARAQFHDRLILDVAHNVEAVAALIEVLDMRIPSASIFLVIGMMRDKPLQEVADLLSPRVARAYCATLPEPRGLSSAVLAATFAGAGVPARQFSDPRVAVRAARQQAGPETWILVTGSFLTVSAVIEDG